MSKFAQFGVLKRQIEWKHISNGGECVKEMEPANELAGTKTRRKLFAIRRISERAVSDVDVSDNSTILQWKIYVNILLLLDDQRVPYEDEDGHT